MKFVRILAITLFILMIPLVAMQFTDEVNWTAGDFIMAGLLLFCAGAVFNYIWITIKKKEYRILLCLVAGFLFCLIWAELAVGVFNSLFAGD